MGRPERKVADARIRFAPSILRRLGEELNPSVDQGILELVKNAYDADATECHIWLDGAGTPDTIVVEDNGVGMDANDIVAGWLVLGDSRKQTAKTTTLGRIPAGNKGLGRLAALRLGRRARMISTPAAGGEFRVDLDWDRFDKARTVDEVEVRVLQNANTTRPRGTRLELSGLRSTVGRVDVRRLARSLVLLADPFSDAKNGFSPVLHSTEYADLAKNVSLRYFDHAEYKLIAKLDAGKASATVTDWKDEVLWQVDDLGSLNEKTSKDYGGLDASFEFWVFVLDQRLFTGRNVQLSAVRDWLGQFGGAHVYVNKLRVSPFGNIGDDWLGINLRRVQSPENRPGTNTSIGRLSVSDPTGKLLQKTDRSGFVESIEFSELTRFSKDALEWMARQRQRESEQKRQRDRQKTKTQATQSSASVQTQIEKVGDEQTKQELRTAFNAYDKARERENEVLRKELQLYRTLSTAGITAATFAHESAGSPLKTISIVTNTLRALLPKSSPREYESTYERALGRITDSVAQLGVLSNATLDLISENKRRVGKVSLNQVVRGVAELFTPFLEGRQVELRLDLSDSGEPYLRGSEAAVESIVTNLLNNSLSAFERSDVGDRLVVMKTTVEDGFWRIVVSDNGPGIVGIAVEDIWLPGLTVRAGGTGLGLTIVRDTLSDLGGEATAVAHGAFGGAEFTIQLPILGVDES